MTETTAIGKQVNELIKEMEAQVITNDKDYEIAGNFVKDAKKTIKLVKDEFEPERKETHKAYKAVTDKISSFVKPLEAAEKVLKKSMTAYFQEQERIRLAEERRLQLEAQKKAEEEALEKAIETGNDEILEMPVITPTVQVKKPEVSGISYREDWDYKSNGQPLDQNFTTVDEKGFVIPDHKKIAGVVKAMKGDTSIPGVAVFSKKIPVVRAA